MKTLEVLVAMSLLSSPCNLNKQVDCPTMADTQTTYICPKECYHEDDGDSFYCGKVEIRLLGADTPEICHPKDGIFIDQEYGREAAGFTYQTLTEAQNITIIEAGVDKYGRVLAHVNVDGELLSVKLIKAGLAYETISVYGDNDMPTFAEQTLFAFHAMPQPLFQNPHDWRKEHQIKVETKF